MDEKIEAEKAKPKCATCMSFVRQVKGTSPVGMCTLATEMRLPSWAKTVEFMVVEETETCDFHQPVRRVVARAQQ